MSIIVAWDSDGASSSGSSDNDERHVARLTLEGYWKWADFDGAVNDIKDMICSVNHTVHVLGDIRLSAQQVKGHPLEHFRTALDKIPANLGLLVIIGQGYFLARMFVAFVRIHPVLRHRTVYVNTEVEAYAALAKYDAASR